MNSATRRTQLIRLLALLSSVSAGAVVVTSDLAEANAPKKVAMLEPQQKNETAKPSKKPAKKRISMGRFEGY